MYGPSGKLGRGGAGKRTTHAPPINRPGRLSVGGGGVGPRGRGGASSAETAFSSLQVEESFGLVRENPPNFGMAIKLAPDLVEEIKRVEAQGGMANIKFGSNAHNRNGNVIQVGDKSFRFTWSRELEDLCDIYEERQSGEDGNGLLVESGATWRKLNVERELDESTKNHVKRRSEEAERKLKARRSIVLDHQTPSMKDQLNLAATGSNPWRNFKHRKEPPVKKPKSDLSSGGHPKSVYKPGLLSTSLSKVKLSSGSPLSSKMEQHGGNASPVGSGNVVKGHAVQNMKKAASSDKEMQSRLLNSATRDKVDHNCNTEGKHADLRSLIISLLSEHQHKGMNLKALEKAVGDSIPNSAKQIEPILKQVATFQAPGKYFLKLGGEVENLKKPPPQTGCSPEISQHQSPAPQKFDQLPAQEPNFSERASGKDGEQGELDSSPVYMIGTGEKIDILNDSPEQFSSKKVPDNSERLAGSSSDSDSDSSNSGSDSGSHKSKSRSPVGSESGSSSSDSESDASTSSKQASDEDVDIMTRDDEKEPRHKMQDSDPPFLKSPLTDNEVVDIGNHEMQDDHVSFMVDIEKISPEDGCDSERPAANCLFPNEDGQESATEIRQPSSDSHERLSKGKSKRLVDNKHSDEKAQSRKRLKSQNFSQSLPGTISSLFGESPSNSSPDRPLDVPDVRPSDPIRTTRDGSHDPNSQCFQLTPPRSVYNTDQLGRKSSDGHAGSGAPHGEKSPGKCVSLDIQTQKASNEETPNKDFLVNNAGPMKFSAEDVGTESNCRKPEMQGKVKEAIPRSNSNMSYSPKAKDNEYGTMSRYSVMNGIGGALQREHSALELGELREPFRDEAPRRKKKSDRKSSSRHVEYKQMDSEHQSSEFSRGQSSKKITGDAGKLLPSNFEALASSIPDAASKKALESDIDDLTRPYQKNTQALQQHYRGNQIEVRAHQNKGPENSSKSRFAEAGTGPAARLDIDGDTLKGVSVNSTELEHNSSIQGTGHNSRKGNKKQKPNLASDTELEHNSIQGSGHNSMEGNKKQKLNLASDTNGRRKDASINGKNHGGQNRKEPLSDGNCSTYTKYEKQEPELKGPIKDDSQFLEYLKEYQEKYDNHCSLKKTLESYSDEFSKLGKDLESYKGRDLKRYKEIEEQIISSFRQCGERHKRHKKIFIVLYQELKHLKQMIKDYAAS